MQAQRKSREAEGSNLWGGTGSTEHEVSHLSMGGTSQSRRWESAGEGQCARGPGWGQGGAHLCSRLLPSRTRMHWCSVGQLD